MATAASFTCIDTRLIADAVLGMSDGLTVPFALSAGLSQFEDTNVVVLGGLAELVAGAISMGLGGYYGARSEVYVAPPSGIGVLHITDFVSTVNRMTRRFEPSMRS